MNMVGNTNYTMYFDLDGNLAAFTEGANGGLVLITNGWHNSTITGAEYAIQAYVDGALKTVNVGTNGARFVGRAGNDNQWNKLRNDFGTAGNVAGPINGNPGKTNNVLTIVANLDGETTDHVHDAGAQAVGVGVDSGLVVGVAALGGDGLGGTVDSVDLLSLGFGLLSADIAIDQGEDDHVTGSQGVLALGKILAGDGNQSVGRNSAVWMRF